MMHPLVFHNICKIISWFQWFKINDSYHGYLYAPSSDYLCYRTDCPNCYAGCSICPVQRQWWMLTSSLVKIIPYRHSLYVYRYTYQWTRLSKNIRMWMKSSRHINNTIYAIANITQLSNDAQYNCNQLNSLYHKFVTFVERVAFKKKVNNTVCKEFWFPIPG